MVLGLGFVILNIEMSRATLLRRRARYHLCLLANLSTSTDFYLDNLVVETGSRREKYLAKYVCKSMESIESNFPLQSRKPRSCRSPTNMGLNKYSMYDGKSMQDIFITIETNIDFRKKVPYDELMSKLIYFSKNGNIKGVKAIQMIIKKYNMDNFTMHSEYKHYVAEALWVNGKIEDSLNLFLSAYTNINIQGKVKLMLHSLFPLLIDQHSGGTLQRTVLLLEKFSVDKQDIFLLALLWKELFKSSWFSDQQLALRILENNSLVIQAIKWMIPGLGRDLLINHKLDDFYRLIELTLKNDLKNFTMLLLQLLFDYHYLHQNLKRCSEVIKYCSTLAIQLSEIQQRRYLQLLLKSKDSVVSQNNIKPPQNICFKF